MKSITRLYGRFFCCDPFYIIYKSLFHKYKGHLLSIGEYKGVVSL